MNNQSENINELMAAMSKAQGVIVSAKKDKTNPYYKSAYADLASVWDACRTALSENGIAVVQCMEPIDVVLMLVTTLGHSSGQWMKSYLPIITQKTDHQSLGSGITYMRKYSLSAITGVAPDEDDDGNEAMGDRNKECDKIKINNGQQQPNNKTITKQQSEMIEHLLTENPEQRPSLMKFLKDGYKIYSLEKIPAIILKRVIDGITNPNTKKAVA